MDTSNQDGTTNGAADLIGETLANYERQIAEGKNPPSLCEAWLAACFSDPLVNLTDRSKALSAIEEGLEPCLGVSQNSLRLVGGQDFVDDQGTK